LLATALRAAVAMVAAMVVVVVMEVAVEVALVLAVVVVVVVAAAVAKLATPVVATATWLVTAPKARSATTAAKLAIFLVIAHLKQLRSESATSASNLDMSRPPAPTKSHK